MQRPSVPVLVGGDGPSTEDRVLDFGDGWMPQGGPLKSVDELRARIERLQNRAAEANRGPIPVTLFAAPYDRASIDQLMQAGVDRCLFAVDEPDEATMLTRLDALAALIA